MSDVHEVVREKYAELARTVSSGASCCSGDCATEVGFGSSLYSADDLAVLPAEAVTASLGCSNASALAELQPGEIVLDLGSGGGIDVLLSARRVGPEGRAIGVDMTDEMLNLAESNRSKSGIDNAEFLKGHIENLPLPDRSVDVIISNCVINLAADKSAVFSEMARVLKPGGRIAIGDIVAADHLSPSDRAERGSYVGCIAGALSFAEYSSGLEKVGFSRVNIETTHQVVPEMFSAIVRAWLR